jgi:hypothetical protein
MTPAFLIGAAIGILLWSGTGRCPEAPPYVLLPSSWPCPVIPACGTERGVCRLPYFAMAGQPCSCRGPEGWIPGVCIRGSDSR